MAKELVGGRCEFCHPSPLGESEWINGKKYSARKLQRLHWYNQFSPTSLRRHLFAENFDPETIDGILRWYEAEENRMHDLRIERVFPEYLPGDEENPEEAEWRRKKRRWALFARECETPEQIEALTRECLGPKGQEAVGAVTRIWRKFMAGEKLVKDELASALTKGPA